MTVYTIGHSTRPLDEFLGILDAFGIEVLGDIRTVPRSRRNPQFEQESLRRSLESREIDYVHLRSLGGLRHARKDSPNLGWENASFRGYADYMQTPEFLAGLADLIALAREKSLVMMCAEAVPWRCHRSLIGDALLIRGVDVQDILTGKRSQAHKLTSWARVNGLEITYPAQ